MKVVTDKQKINQLLTRRVEKVLPSKEGFKKLLLSGKRIRLYQGFDPTGYRLHLGHTIGLRKLMEFANLGHEVIFLFGTGTVLAGDPSHRVKARSREFLEKDEKTIQQKINHNIKDWKKQTSAVVDFDNPNLKIKKNGDWLCNLRLKDILNIASHLSAIQLFKRESFQRRLDRGDTVWYHETMYPLLQGYDSVVMDVDLEIGGTDQEFNMLVGRELLHKMKGKEKFVMTIPMILGTDGKQMSKTSGNCIWLDDAPKNMYGKVMTVQDQLIGDYFEYFTDIPIKEVVDVKKNIKSSKINPMTYKKQLAWEITKQFHGQKAADQAQKEFEKVHQKGKLPTKIPTFPLKSLSQNPINVVDLLVGTAVVPSKSEAKRLIAQKAVEINNQLTTSNQQLTIKPNDIIKVGKRKWIKIK